MGSGHEQDSTAPLSGQHVDPEKAEDKGYTVMKREEVDKPTPAPPTPHGHPITPLGLLCHKKQKGRQVTHAGGHSHSVIQASLSRLWHGEGQHSFLLGHKPCKEVMAYCCWAL